MSMQSNYTIFSAFAFSRSLFWVSVFFSAEHHAPNVSTHTHTDTHIPSFSQFHEPWTRKQNNNGPRKKKKINRVKFLNCLRVKTKCLDKRCTIFRYKQVFFLYFVVLFWNRFLCVCVCVLGAICRHIVWWFCTRDTHNKYENVINKTNIWNETLQAHLSTRLDRLTTSTATKTRFSSLANKNA